jgi:DNA topoisomerase 2-associated protein PAT1
MFDHLCQFLFGNLLSLFPSTRMAASLPLGPNYYLRMSKAVDLADQSVWQFLAALALCASNEQQQRLVTELREKVLENVVSATKGWVSDESERQAKLDNVNLFLHALGLDSSQIAV